MSDESAKSRVRRQRSLYKVHYALQPPVDMPRPLHALTVEPEPSAGAGVGPGLAAYDRQVAGHRTTSDTKYSGLLQCSNGRILKPITKESQKREVDFYNRLVSTENRDLIELRKFTPKYYGFEKFTYNGYEQDYVVLEDLTMRMLEPCIMDVKIGRRTWDPLATEDKIQNEQRKYALCKQEYGFCIPGYQVYRLSTGKLQKYNKEHGKKLHGQMVKDAIRNYLNGAEPGAALCRALLLQLVAQLWALQRWARRQRAVRLYSASLLLAYDAARLRACCAEADAAVVPLCRPAPAAARRRSIHSTHSPCEGGSSLGGRLTAAGVHYAKVGSAPPLPSAQARELLAPPAPAAPPSGPPSPAGGPTGPWAAALERLHHNHSFDHNYEDKLSKIKMNYRALLDQLSNDSPNPNPWGTVKIIDFAHAFFNEDENASVDENFRDGVDIFVNILESFLRETDDQIF